jgi:hypothetical protein
MRFGKQAMACAVVLLLLAGVADAAFVLVPRGSTVDVDSDGTADLMVEQCFDCGAFPNRIVHLLELDLRRRRHQQREEPLPRLRRGRDLQRLPHRQQRGGGGPDP